MRLCLTLLVCCATALVPLPATAADSLKIIVIDGDEAANIVANKIAAEPVIEVRDRDDRRVPNAIVRFLIRKTARNRLAAAFRNGQAEVRTLTDATGRASANFLTPLEPGSFQIDVVASFQGQTGKATINHTNYATSADAKSAGREPGKSTSSNAQAPSAGATAATTTATTAAVAAGGGMSKLAVVGLVAGGAAGAGAAVVLTQRGSDSPAGRVTAVTASQAVGIEVATPFTFSVQATDFEAASLAYRWEFGDGGTSTEAAPTHIYNSAGTFTVVVTVNDARQSARSETSVTVRPLTGTWIGAPVGNSTTTLQLTQSGSTIGGTVSVAFTAPVALVYTDCPIAGSVQSGMPVTVTLDSPACRHPTAGRTLQPATLQLTVGADGQTLSGTEISPGFGTSPISLRRQ